MNLTGTELIQIIAMLLGASLGYSVLRIWILLKQDKTLASKVKGNTIALSKLKGELKNFQIPAANQGTAIEQSLSNLNLTALTFEQAAEMLGLDEKDINNPIIRPLMEKIFENIKQKQLSQTEDLDIGY